MIDQAAELRKLVLRAMRENQAAEEPPPRLVLLTSGHSGVGVTTVGVNLAVALSQQGLRVVLVDANAVTGSVARLCHLTSDLPVPDLLGRRRDIHEFLQLGPAGIQVVPGIRAGLTEPEISSLAIERLVRQLTHLGRHADSVLIDLGNGPNDLLRRLAQAADDVIVVTSPENLAITDAYARIKLTLSGTSPAVLWLIVNLARDAEQAADVHKRIRQSCERFLGHGIRLLGYVPVDHAVTTAEVAGLPLVAMQAETPASRAIHRIANDFVGREGSGGRPKAAA